MVAEAEPVLHAAGVADRCQRVAGNFFDQVPPAADLYILSNIVHDWDDGSALQILGTCRSAMRADSRLLIIELVLPDDPGRPWGSCWTSRCSPSRPIDVNAPACSTPGCSLTPGST
ncbi:methyltransferase [Geodermatophilus sp. CPCC 205761]|uniref:methyltransferase n=1 Tax=Geodermatophilus sp. CPCC 205761 TaxID=2936597 RepID=UPI003F53A6C4